MENQLKIKTLANPCIPAATADHLPTKYKYLLQILHYRRNFKNVPNNLLEVENILRQQSCNGWEKKGGELSKNTKLVK